MSDTKKKEKPAFAEFWYSIKIHENPTRLKRGLSPIIRSEARKLYRMMGESGIWRRV